MPNKINLITGETYTLAELFSGERRIIIPDLQRDYCWGNSESSTDRHGLVPRFIDTLVDQFDLFMKQSHFGRLNLGLIYGYETPANYVQLCDGQQRITTLFLLLGMLNKWSVDDVFRRYLMSDYEFFEDDHEPYLQYSIRESSLYFLSDLVYRFFASGGESSIERVSEIYDKDTGKSCDWFYGDYATDPSILSMLNTLRIIEEQKERFRELGYERFCEFLVERLTFIYYDMGNRANGEETFVVINTTGEPLSATENLKPLVINADINQQAAATGLSVLGKSGLTVAQAWEEMECWFWRNRDKKVFDTADSGFREFLRWVAIIVDPVGKYREKALSSPGSFIFPHREISVTAIVEYFNAFVDLHDNYGSFTGRASEGGTETGPGAGGVLKQIEAFVLLPLLSFRRRNPGMSERDLRRVYEFFHNLTRISNVAKSVNSLMGAAVAIGENCADILDLLNPSFAVSATLLSREERDKLQIIYNFDKAGRRSDVEEALWAAQRLEVDRNASLFEGEIMPLITWSGGVDGFSLDAFNHYLGLLRQVFSASDANQNDITRRALIAFRYPGFPLNGISYGWGSNWNRVILTSPMRFKDFLDDVSAYGREGVITRNWSGIGKHAVFVHEPRLLAYCNNKNVRSYSGWGECLCLNDRARPVPVRLALIILGLGGKIIAGRQSVDNSWALDYNPGARELTLSRKHGYCLRVITADKSFLVAVSLDADPKNVLFEISLNYNRLGAFINWLAGASIAASFGGRRGGRCRRGGCGRRGRGRFGNGRRR